jgi:hypothetical protein
VLLDTFPHRRKKKTRKEKKKKKKRGEGMTKKWAWKKWRRW